MKKHIAFVIALVYIFALVGCQKTTSGSEIYSFPEPTPQITGTFYSQGQATEFENGLSAASVIKWFYDLKLTPCDKPEAVDGSESYCFYVKDENVFTYEDRGGKAYIIIGGNYYQVNDPSAPPIN